MRKGINGKREKKERKQKEGSVKGQEEEGRKIEAKGGRRSK